MGKPYVCTETAVGFALICRFCHPVKFTADGWLVEVLEETGMDTGDKYKGK